MDKYLKRIADTILKDKLDSSSCVLIKGPKWCGKSTTAEQISKSAVYMHDPSTKEQNIALAKNAPSIFLQGSTPKLIDEWQTIPFIWDSIRFESDIRGEFGQFILTGSATPVSKKEYEHSGTGRITTMVMRPMTLSESGDSTKDYSIEGLFNERYPAGSVSNKTIQDYAFLTCRGGWPKSVGVSEKVAINIASNYFQSLVEEDIPRLNGIHVDLDKIKATIRSYARNSASECSIQTIADDVLKNDVDSISLVTITSYLNGLRDIYVIEDIDAWNPNLRSKTAIRTSPTRHFVDPSIACAALGLGPNDLIGDLHTFGLLFESLVVRDLKTYAEYNGGNVYHYRDKNGLEADAVIHLKNGKWAAFEVKLADSDSIEQGAKNLLKLASNIDDSKMKKPSFLAVITATQNAYRREDGVFVIPLGCLKE